MFSRHGGKAAKAQSNDSADGGSNPQAIARYKNQAAKAREKIVDLVKERDKIENDYNETMNKNELLTDERDALIEERDNLLKLKNILQKERDSAVAEKDEAVHELEVATEAKDWAVNDMKNAKEDAEVQRRAKDKASKEAQALKNTVTKSVAEKKQAKQELMETNALLTTANFDNRKANGEIKRLKKEVEDKIQEMKQELDLAALNLQRTRALGEDRESELNRWVEKLTYQIYALRKQMKREKEIQQSKWRHEQDQRLTSLIHAQQKKMEHHQHLLLLAMSDPLLGSTAGLKSKKQIKTSKIQLRQLAVALETSNTELHRLRNVTVLIEQLVAASAEGQASKVRHLVRNHPTIIDSLNIENQSAIQVAAKQGHFDCCKTLLDANCDAEPIHDMGTPLYLASQGGHYKVVGLLMAAKYRIPLYVVGTKQDGRTALHTACCNGHLKCVQLLSNNSRQDFNITDADHRTPLHLVCTKCVSSRLLTSERCEIIRLLLQRGSAMHARDRAGNTPILLAAMAGCIPMVETCIEVGGASILDRNRAGKSPIDEARLRKDTRMMERLNELQKNIPRSVVLASRFKGYNVTGQNVNAGKVDREEDQQTREARERSKESNKGETGVMGIMGIMGGGGGKGGEGRKGHGNRGPAGGGGGGGDHSSNNSTKVLLPPLFVDGDDRAEDESPDASELLVMQSRTGSRLGLRSR